MSIIIHFNTASFIPSKAALPSTNSCISRANTRLDMVAGIDQSDGTVMSDDESSQVDIATSNTLYTHSANELKSTSIGSCFGLPYQDHNYGAPPPPSPPSYSPCVSPAHNNGIPDEDTNLSIVSTTSINEETQEGSITRCICGFEHDDEYMICCDMCLVWQHVDCMGLDRNNIPDTYLCEKCQPRKVDRHKAKVLQARKKVAMTDTSDSDDNTNNKTSERKLKSRSRRRQKDDEKSADKNQLSSGKRGKNVNKHSKERMEIKRSRMRRSSKKESTSTADEEAQDAWEYSVEWCEKNFEPAVSNQYTPEIQHLARSLPVQGHEKRLIELLLTRNCQVVEENEVKKLISAYDIPRDQPLVEYKGKFLLATQFHDLHPVFNKRLFPYVMFYLLHDTEICVDASLYGNEARFIRRSCKPNSELRYLVSNGNLHLYVSSTKAVFKDDEITLPFDLNQKEGFKDTECACQSENCLLKQRKDSTDSSSENKKKGSRLTLSADDDSSHSLIGINTSPVKSKLPSKFNNEAHEGKSDYESEDHTNDQKKKTREERKIDAIMRAFDQMEKAAKRRQQALERQKAHSKSEEIPEKSEITATAKEEEKQPLPNTVVEKQGNEEEKTTHPVAKVKKGKRRRGSGTPSRRRTRTNSGCSDIVSQDESALSKCSSAVTTVTNSETCVQSSTVTSTCPATTVPSALSPVPTMSPVLKTKRVLLHEWLQEKSENPPSSPVNSPLSIRTEINWNSSTPNPTFYVQCTKDNPHSSGISAAHLRSSSTSGSMKSLLVKSGGDQGSAKKRWLRQAMFDCNTCEEPLTIDANGIDGLSLEGSYLSPNSHNELCSPGGNNCDTVTPLKKRRLVRASIESETSSKSPRDSIENHVNISDIKCEPILHLSENSATALEMQKDVNNSLMIYPVDSIAAEIKDEMKDLKPVLLTSLKNVSCGIGKCPSNDSRENNSMQTNCDLTNRGGKSESINHCISLSQIPCETSKVIDSCRSISESNQLVSTIGTCENSLQGSSKRCVASDLLNNCGSVKKKFSFAQEQSNTFLSISETGSVQSSECKNDKCTTEILTDKSILPSSDLSDVSSSKNPFQVKEHNVVNRNVSTMHDHYANKQSTDSTFNETMQSSGEKSNCKNKTSHNSKGLDCNYSPSSELCNALSAASNTEIKSQMCDSSKNIFQMDSKFRSSDQNSLTVKSPISLSSQKRKVSLSEYRLRMKDSGRRVSLDSAKSTNSVISSITIPENLPDQVSLAPLPLFETAVSDNSKTTLKNKKKEKRAEETTKTTDQRENLTERLKREFGFDDSRDSPLSEDTKNLGSCNASQPPPPPPPPPPRPQNAVNASGASASKFAYSAASPFIPSYIVPRVPGAQYMTVQPHLAQVIHPVHSVSTPRLQCSMRPQLLQPTHSFSSSLPNTVLRPSIQHEYSSVNAQNYATLVQQPPPPPPPPPKCYPHIYQPGVYK